MSNKIEEFGDRLRMARRYRNYSMQKLCYMMGKHKASEIGAWEEGRLPNARALASLAKALGVSADWLLGLSDDGGPRS